MTTKLKKRSNERGQVAILFALVFTFMFILFAFVIDFSHLVNTKINLQLAADAAAYSGAAWQANTLNRIGMLNFRLRQDLKELAMRVNVTHLRHNRNFPRGAEFINGGHQPPPVQPFICQQAHGYVALSGRRYSSDTNLCRNASPETGGLPPIIVPPVIAAFDPFAIALQQQIRRIADEANAECAASARDNELLSQHLINTYTRRSQFHSNEIRTIGDWLNQTGGGALTENEGHPIRRVVWESARRNLALASADDFRIEILQPQGNEYIRLEEQKLSASLFYLRLNVVGDGCVGRPSFIDFNDMVATVTKTPEVITYLAVKLSARPKMLFMPQAWLDGNFPLIEAFAAAKPFGSRTGPDPQMDQLMPTPNRAGNIVRMLNFSVRPGDTNGIVDTKLISYFDALHPFNDASRPDVNRETGWPEPGSGSENFRTALQAIHAPTIFDALFYPVFPNPNQPNDYLEQELAEAGYPDYLEAADPTGQIIQNTQPRTPAYFPLTGNRGEGWIQIDAKNSANGAYGNYSDEGPDSHSVTTAVGLPFITEGNAADFGFATRDVLHSGWAPPGRPGRIGYSVKFIGFNVLMGNLVIRGANGAGNGQIANRPTGDPNLNKILH